MRYVIGMPELRRLSENYILSIGTILIRHIIQALEPNQIDRARTIRELTNQPFTPPLAQRIEKENKAYSR